jgi:hypothetical protein
MNKLNKGLTLVELNVASSIAIIVLLAIGTFYIFSWRNFNTGNTLLDVYLNSRNASRLLTRDIRCARQVLQQQLLDSGTTYYTDINTSGDSHSIVLMVPSIDTTGASIIDQSGQIDAYKDYIIYQLQGNDLARIVQIDSKFNTTGDPYYHRNGRKNEISTKAHYCSSLTFSFYDHNGNKVTNLDLGNADIVAIYLPINKSTLALSGTGTEVEQINPTTKVRLRNKVLN